MIEQKIRGREVSLLALTDGARIEVLAAAEDHKTIFDGDRGPNTGGMGAFAPAPRVDAALEAEIGRRIVHPVLEAMAVRGTP